MKSILLILLTLVSVVSAVDFRSYNASNCNSSSLNTYFSWSNPYYSQPDSQRGGPCVNVSSTVIQSVSYLCNNKTGFSVSAWSVPCNGTGYSNTKFLAFVFAIFYPGNNTNSTCIPVTSGPLEGQYVQWNCAASMILVNPTTSSTAISGSSGINAARPMAHPCSMGTALMVIIMIVMIFIYSNIEWFEMIIIVMKVGDGINPVVLVMGLHISFLIIVGECCTFFPVICGLVIWLASMGWHCNHRLWHLFDYDLYMCSV